MFAENRGDYVCGHSVVTDSDRRIESGHFTAPDGTVTEGKCYSADIDISGDFRISFWDRGTVGEEQNHYDWILENGTSKVVHYNGWSAEIICKEISCDIPEGTAHIELTADEDSFKITLNDKVIHEHTLGAIPHISAVCTVDRNSGEVISKIVNFSENEIPLTIVYDTLMAETADMTVLTADSYSAQNSFESPEAVIPYKVKIQASREFSVSVKPRSVNVIRHKLSK